MPHYVYILQCSDKSYYVGSTSDLTNRIAAHNAGKGAFWTSKRLPVKLIYHEKYDDQSKAIKRERQLKGWSRAKKQALIDSELELLRRLSKAKRQRKPDKS